MRNRRKLKTSLYRGKSIGHAYGHFKMKKRLKIVRGLKDLKSMHIKAKGLATKAKYNNPKKYGLKRKRYYPKSMRG